MKKQNLQMALGVTLTLAALAFTDMAQAQAAVPTLGDNDERLPYHLDSLIALAIGGYALLVALALNHRRPGIRVFGIAMGALGCVAVAGGILALDLAGQFVELRPSRFSIDPSKPVVMRVMAVVFFAAGLTLTWVARRQSRRSDELVLPRRNEASRFGRTSRLYHWIIAILFLLLVPMGVFTTMIPYHIEYRQIFYVVHKSVGLTVFLLAAGRVIWLMLSPPPKLASQLKGWERFAAKTAHYAFYFFLFAFPISGYVLGTSLGKLSHFYFWDLPLLWGPDEASLSAARWMHKIILPFTFYLVLLGHILGAVKHQYIDGDDDSFRRMVT